MQKVTIPDRQNLHIHCPFCGALAISPDGLKECKHTLFHASDYGFEFISDKLDIDAKPDLGELDMDEFTDTIKYTGAIKFVIFQPSNTGYVAFAYE